MHRAVSQTEEMEPLLFEWAIRKKPVNQVLVKKCNVAGIIPMILMTSALSENLIKLTLLS